MEQITETIADPAPKHKGGWTPEARAKAIESRRRKVEQRIKARQRAIVRKQDKAAEVLSTNAQPAENSTKIAGDPNDWQNMPIDDARTALGRLQSELERARRIVSSRQSVADLVSCAICGTKMDSGRVRARDDSSTDPKTGLVSPKYQCSTRCFEIYWQKKRQKEMERRQRPVA